MPMHPLTTVAFFDHRNEVKVVAKVVCTVVPSHPYFISLILKFLYITRSP